MYKLTVRSVIDYALPVYYKCLTQSQIGRLEDIQYRAGKIVTGALHFTSKEKLNLELGWESIFVARRLTSLILRKTLIQSILIFRMVPQ